MHEKLRGMDLNGLLFTLKWKNLLQENLKKNQNHGLTQQSYIKLIMDLQSVEGFLKE